MPFIEWSSRFSVDVNSVDHQHQQLVHIINDLHDAMKSGKGKEALGASLNNLLDYTKTHFDHEEKNMKLKNYPDLAEHTKQHNDLIKQVKDYKAKFDNGEALLTIEVMDFLRDWLLNHIMKSDKRMGTYLKESGVS